MIDQRFRCYMPSFNEIVPEKIFEEFSLYGRGSHLGHVTKILRRTNILFPLPKDLHKIWLWLALFSAKMSEHLRTTHGYTIRSPGEHGANFHLNLV